MTTIRHGRLPLRRRVVLAVSAAVLVAVAMPFMCFATPAKGSPRTVPILIPGRPIGTQAGADAFGTGARATLLKVLPADSSVYVEYTDLAGLGPAEQGKLLDWYAAKYR